MNNLIKNELIKIFNKKSVYIILLITLAFMILNSVLSKIFSEDNINNLVNNKDFYEQQIKNLDQNDPDEKEMYIAFSTQLEICKIAEKYGMNSWQYQIGKESGYDIIENMLASEGTEDYDANKKIYDEFMAKLEKDDCMSFIKQELENVNSQIKELKNSGTDGLEIKTLEISKQALEWRLEKNISYTKSNMNSFISIWEQNQNTIEQIKDSEKTQSLTSEDKYSQKNAEATAAICKYAIENNIQDKKALFKESECILGTDADMNLINVFSGYSIFIIILIVVIAGTIISEEFNKGTIKLLLVRPYKRTKILVAKFLTCIIMLIFTFLAVGLMQYIISGFTYGFGNFTGDITIYNYSSSSVQTIGLLQYVLFMAVSVMPMFILLMTLAFALSTIFTNSPIAIALPLLGMMGTDIINQLAYSFEKAKFLMYFVTPNWDLSIYLFGKMPQFEPISLPFSIMICVIYFVIMVVTSLIIFNKKDIKNI